VEEEYEKVWPRSKRAKDVLDVLLARLVDSGAKLCCSSPAEAIRPPSREQACWSARVGEEWVTTRQLILALGGCSYPSMGTVGQGYDWMQGLGLDLNPPLPALVGLNSDVPWVRELAGLSLYDVELQLREGTGKIVRRRARPLLFTHKGISGPGPMDLSRDFEREPDRFQDLYVDLLPGRQETELTAILFRGGGELASTLQKELGLQRRLVRALLERIGIAGLPAAQVPRSGRQFLIRELKGLRIPIRGSLGFAKAEGTTGGLALDQVDPATMEVRDHPGLFVVGELLDVDGPIGGFSFWMAFSTAVLAGRAAAAACR
jgi:predicted Rossmann fold flavoprotein